MTDVPCLAVGLSVNKPSTKGEYAGSTAKLLNITAVQTAD